MDVTAERLLSLEEIAAYLGVPVRTVYSWRGTGRGPRGLRVGKYVRYRPRDLEAWLDELASRDGAA